MRTTDIIEMLKSDKIINLSDRNILDALSASMLKIYALSGAAKTYEKEQLRDEVIALSNALLPDLRKDFAGLSVSEIDFAFMCGLQGKCPEKTYGLNYKTFYTWLDWYYNLSDRILAINEAKKISSEKQITATASLTEGEKENIIKNNIQFAYEQFLKGPVSTIPGTIGTVITKDAQVVDIGGAMKRYLVRTNRMNISETLGGFFNRMKKQSITHLFNHE